MLSYVKVSTLAVDIITYPFKWKVKRSHADFVAIRAYLLKMYP